ncbi:MAG: SHOCT domain-containing protein [Acidimicrobiia bacterium]|nr:SHOCT domain-containing protein [Acidimicrobiia bacterium]
MPLLNLFWTMLWFFMFIIWIWLLISIFGDIFRNKEQNGWAKAAWVLFIIILPLLGALIYIIVHGHAMQERAMQDAAEREKMTRAYIQDAAGGAGSADELAKLADLHSKGVLTDAEFAAQKAKLLA